MDVVLVLAAVVVGVLIVWLLIRRWRWRRAPMAFLQTYRSSPALQAYAQLRRRYIAGAEVAADQDYRSAADAVVAELGVGFDPRVPAWTRLGSLEPELVAFIGRRFDLSAEEPMDIDAFAEALLLARYMQPRLDSPMAWWASATGIGMAFAADWRVAQSSTNPRARPYTRDEAFEEGGRVMDRFFQSGAWYWDFEHGLAIDSEGRPFSGQAVASLTGVTGATTADEPWVHPEASPPSESGGPGPDLGQDIWRMLASGQHTTLTPSIGTASADGAALAPELGSSWRWTPSGPAPSPGPGQSASASRLPGDGVFQTKADPTLQLDALAQLLQHIAIAQLGSDADPPSAPRPAGRCEDAYVASIVPMHAAAWPGEPLPPQFANDGTWFERWTLGCGVNRVPFAVAFTPSPNGGTLLSASSIE